MGGWRLLSERRNKLDEARKNGSARGSECGPRRRVMFARANRGTPDPRVTAGFQIRLAIANHPGVGGIQFVTRDTLENKTRRGLAIDDGPFRAFRRDTNFVEDRSRQSEQLLHSL